MKVPRINYAQQEVVVVDLDYRERFFSPYETDYELNTWLPIWIAFYWIRRQPFF